MEVGEIGSETDQDQSVLEVPAINWAKYVGVKSVQYIKMGHAPKMDAEEPNNWDLGNVVSETEKYFATDLSGKTATRQYSREVFPVRKETVFQIRTDLLRRQNNSIEGFEDNHHQSPSKETHSNNKNVNCSKTF